MTEDQFQKLMDKLEEINQNIIVITAKDAGKEKWSLSDVCSELSSVTSAVSSVETSVDRVKSAVDNIDFSG
jgi:septation ring formation regulator EzrA